jgi:hypothetical protein
VGRDVFFTDEDIPPDFLLKTLLRDQFAAVLNQHLQDLQCLAVEAKPLAAPEQLLLLRV